MFVMTFTGNLGSEPEFAYTPSAKAYCKLNVAVSSGKDKPAFWVKVTVWEKGAEAVANMKLTKGSRVVVQTDRVPEIELFERKAGGVGVSFNVTSSWVEAATPGGIRLE